MRYLCQMVRRAPYLLAALCLPAFSLAVAAETPVPKHLSPERVAHVHIATNNVDGIRLLMRKGLDVQATHYFGWSPLYAAARMGRVEIVRAMLEQGASPNFRQTTDESSDPNSLPLIAEVLGWMYYLSPHMQEAEGNAHVDPANWRKVAELLIERSVEINEVFVWGQVERTYLSIAAEYNDFDMVKRLVKRGADVNLPGDSWRAPLFWSVKNGNVEMARWLLKKGANMYAVGIPENEDVSTPVDHALRYSPEAALLMLSNGADPNGHAFLYWAIGQRHHQLLGQLIKKGVDVNAFIKRDTSGFAPTPLGLAALMGDPKAVEMLLRAGADPCKEDDAGYRAYDVAMKWKRASIVGVLDRHDVRRRCTAESRDDTVLHLDEAKSFAQLQELIQIKFLQYEAQLLGTRLLQEYGILELTRNELYRELNQKTGRQSGLTHWERMQQLQALDRDYLANDYARGYRDTRSVEQDIDRKARSLQEENIYQLLDQSEEVFDSRDQQV